MDIYFYRNIEIFITKFLSILIKLILNLYNLNFLIISCLKINNLLLSSFIIQNFYLPMRLTDVYCRVLDDVIPSFIFGVVTNSLKNTFKENNFIVKQINSVQKGFEVAKTSLIYNMTMVSLERLKIQRSLCNFLSMFISSFLAGKRNGIYFALKNGVFAIFFNTLTSFLR